jgi:hypothetical protein
MPSHNHAYAVEKLVAASRIVESQKTVYEGLYAACLGPLQCIDAAHDLNRDERVSFLRWRRRIFPRTARPYSVSDLAAALRQLDASEADDIARELSQLGHALVLKPQEQSRS